MNSRYYNYSVNMNGKKIKHGFEYNKDYYPDLIANDSVAFLRQSKHNFARKPVMLVASFPAPHGPEDSAPQFSNLFFNITTHQWVVPTLLSFVNIYYLYVLHWGQSPIHAFIYQFVEWGSDISEPLCIIRNLIALVSHLILN